MPRFTHFGGKFSLLSDTRLCKRIDKYHVWTYASLSSRQSLSLSTMNKIYTTLQKFVRACVQVCVFACVVIYAKVLPGSVL